MVWFEGVYLEIVNHTDFHIHTKMRVNSLGAKCYLIGFYVAPKTGKWAESWNLFKLFNVGMETSWCIIGNFNEITTQDEKVGGRPWPTP